MALTVEFSSVTTYKSNDGTKTVDVGTCATDDLILIFMHGEGDKGFFNSSSRTPSYDGSYSGTSTPSGPSSGAGYPTCPTGCFEEINNVSTAYFGYIVCNSGDSGQSRTVSFATTCGDVPSSKNFGISCTIVRLRGVDTTSLFNVVPTMSQDTTPDAVAWSGVTIANKVGIALTFAAWMTASPHTVGSASGGSWVREAKLADGTTSGASRNSGAYVARHAVSSSATLADLSISIDGTANFSNKPHVVQVVVNELASDVFSETLSSSATPSSSLGVIATKAKTLSSSAAPSSWFGKSIGAQMSSHAQPRGVMSLLRSKKIYTIGDSIIAWASHEGSTIDYADFGVWSGTRFYDVPSGAASGHTYGITTEDDGSFGGLTPEGFTSHGILRDRLQHFGLQYVTTEVLEYAIPGTLLSSWKFDIPGVGGNGAVGTDPYAPTVGKWQGFVPSFLASADDDVVVITAGGNDIFGQGKGNAVIDASNQSTLDAAWDNFFSNLRDDASDILEYIKLLCAYRGRGTDVVVVSYPYFPCRDWNNNGVPLRYPPHSSSEAVFTCTWLTDGFGFYRQWQVDSTYEINRYATAQATAGVPANSGPPFYIPTDYPTRYSYWQNQQNNAIAADILNGTSTINSINPSYWANAVQNFTNDTLNGVMERLTDDVWGLLETDYVGDPWLNYMHIETWSSDLYDYYSTDTRPKKAMRRERWIEGVHMDPDGMAAWVDTWVPQWMSRSMYQDLVQISRPRMRIGVAMPSSATPQSSLLSNLTYRLISSITPSSSFGGAGGFSRMFESAIAPTSALGRMIGRVFSSSATPDSAIGGSVHSTLSSSFSPSSAFSGVKNLLAQTTHRFFRFFR